MAVQEIHRPQNAGQLAVGSIITTIHSLPRPTTFMLCAGSSEGETELTAFDGALLKAGIANVNLLRVSSILPPGAKHHEKLDIPPGSLVPTAYGSITSDVPGQTISACIGVGLSADTYGVIMEFSGVCGAKQAEDTIKAMIKEAFTKRNLPLVKTMVKSVEHKVEKIGCVFAAVPLWY